MATKHEFMTAALAVVATMEDAKREKLGPVPANTIYIACEERGLSGVQVLAAMEAAKIVRVVRPEFTLEPGDEYGTIVQGLREEGLIP